MTDAHDLDDRRFVMVSSTASRVDSGAPTRFEYHERDGLVWGDYAGDTVSAGRFVGVRRGDALTVSFVHLPIAGGAPVAGEATSRIERTPDGLRLVEEFEAGGVPQTSVCVEVR